MSVKFAKKLARFNPKLTTLTKGCLNLQHYKIMELYNIERDFLNASAPDLAARMLKEASEAYKKQFKYRVDWHKINEQIKKDCPNANHLQNCPEWLGRLFPGSNP